MSQELPTKTVLKTSKNRKIIFVLVAAVLFAFLAAFAAYKLLTPSRTTVFVFEKEYTAGTQVTRSMLVPLQVDSTILTGGRSFTTGDYYVTGTNINAVLQSAGILRTDVQGGTALMSSMLTTTGGNSIEMAMRKDAIAITIGVNNISGVTDELSYGSRVNVYASYEIETVLMLQNIRVLRTTHNNGLTSVTLELDHEQSMRLVHASTFGLIHLGLVDANGYQYTQEEQPIYDFSGFVTSAETDGNSGYEWQPNPESNYSTSAEGEGTAEDPIVTEEGSVADIVIG
jgi:Flp pilus assembly protein CpaB